MRLALNSADLLAPAPAGARASSMTTMMTIIIAGGCRTGIM